MKEYVVTHSRVSSLSSPPVRVEGSMSFLGYCFSVHLDPRSPACHRWQVTGMQTRTHVSLCVSAERLWYQ